MTLPVSQEAREAAADYLSRFNGLSEMEKRRVVACCRDNWASVQAFARFESTIREQCARLAEECEIAGVLTPGWADGASSAARQIATAIREGSAV